MRKANILAIATLGLAIASVVTNLIRTDAPLNDGKMSATPLAEHVMKTGSLKVEASAPSDLPQTPTSDDTAAFPQRPPFFLGAARTGRWRNSAFL